jgi:hypothetical protein
LQELASQKQLVQSLQEDKASLLQKAQQPQERLPAQQQPEQQLTPRSSTAGAAAEGVSMLQQQMSPQASMQQLAAAASPAAGQQDELASMAQQLAQSKKELQEALAAAAEMQQQARQLRLQLHSRCACHQAGLSQTLKCVLQSSRDFAAFCGPSCLGWKYERLGTMSSVL